MLGRFYEIIESELATLTNDAGEAPFASQPALLAREVVEADLAIRPGWPLAVIKFVRAGFATGEDLHRHDDTRERSEPEKDGAGTSELALSGPFYGNGNWMATCTSGGTVGSSGILFTVDRTGYDPETGEAGDTTSAEGLELGADGTLVLADGTTATFGAGTVEAGDEWTWTTRNYRTYIIQQRKVTNEYRIEVYFAERLEHLTEQGKWLDKLLNVFLAQYIHADDQIFEQDLKSAAPEHMVDESNAIEAFKYTFELELTGLIYRTESKPLLGTMTVQAEINQG